MNRLADFGKHVGIRVVDLFFLRAGKDKREVRLTPMLVFIQKVFWKVNQLKSRKKKNILINYKFFSFYLIVKLIILNNMHKIQMFVCIKNFSFSYI